MRGYSALEDVPMIVPIAVALILFFSSLSWAIKTVSETNRKVDSALTVLTVADAFAQWGVLTKNTFKRSCRAIASKTKDFGFLVFIVDPDKVPRGEEVEDWLENDLGTCLYTNGDSTCCSNISEKPGPKTPLYIRFFPVVYQSGNGVNDVNIMVVVVWPKG